MDSDLIRWKLNNGGFTSMIQTVRYDLLSAYQKLYDLKIPSLCIDQKIYLIQFYLSYLNFDYFMLHRLGIFKSSDFLWLETLIYDPYYKILTWSNLNLNPADLILVWLYTYKILFLLFIILKGQWLKGAWFRSMPIEEAIHQQSVWLPFTKAVQCKKRIGCLSFH